MNHSKYRSSLATAFAHTEAADIELAAYSVQCQKDNCFGKRAIQFKN